MHIQFYEMTVEKSLPVEYTGVCATLKIHAKHTLMLV